MKSFKTNVITGLNWPFICSTTIVLGFSGATYAANAEKSSQPLADLSDLLSDSERAAIKKEAALQDYRESKGAKDPKNLQRPEDLKNEYSDLDEDRKDRTKSSVTKRSEQASSTTLRRRSFTSYKPGSQSPARNLKSTPGTRAFGK